MNNVVGEQPDRKVKRKHTNMEDTDVKIPIEKWMQSQDASGFPKIIGKILDQLDLDSLINCRQVSMTFKNFLDTNFGLDFWIENLCQIRKKYYLARVRLGLVYLAKQLVLYRNYPNYTLWTGFINTIKIEGSIDDIIKQIKLIKQSEKDGRNSPIVLKWKNENNDLRPPIFCIL